MYYVWHCHGELWVQHVHDPLPQCSKQSAGRPASRSWLQLHKHSPLMLIPHAYPQGPQQRPAAALPRQPSHAQTCRCDPACWRGPAPPALLAVVGDTSSCQCARIDDRSYAAWPDIAGKHGVVTRVRLARKDSAQTHTMHARKSWLYAAIYHAYSWPVSIDQHFASDVLLSALARTRLAARSRIHNVKTLISTVQQPCFATQ
jgi:hypothetical protein